MSYTIIEESVGQWALGVDYVTSNHYRTAAEALDVSGAAFDDLLEFRPLRYSVDSSVFAAVDSMAFAPAGWPRKVSYTTLPLSFTDIGFASVVYSEFLRAFTNPSFGGFRATFTVTPAGSYADGTGYTDTYTGDSVMRYDFYRRAGTRCGFRWPTKRIDSGSALAGTNGGSPLLPLVPDTGVAISVSTRTQVFPAVPGIAGYTTTEDVQLAGNATDASLSVNFCRDPDKTIRISAVWFPGSGAFAPLLAYIPLLVGSSDAFYGLPSIVGGTPISGAGPTIFGVATELYGAISPGLGTQTFTPSLTIEEI